MFIDDRDRKLLSAIHQYQRYRDRSGPLAWLLRSVGKLRHAVWTVLSASDIHRDATIAASARFPHPNGVVIHRDAVIGAECLIMQQVTVGQTARPEAPVIGRGVYIGAGAKVLGGIRVGDGARIGANAVVLADVPDGATAVGVPSTPRS